jgi:hypothetical protein
MTHFHMDVWTPDAVDAPNALMVKLVDFGPDGAYGGDDAEHELTFTAETTPALQSGTWVSLDIPLADFANLTTRGHLAQMIISGVEGLNTLYVDNVYFYQAEEEAPTEPSVAAPTPTADAAGVISLFSDAYTDVEMATWSADHWPDQADVADATIAGDAVKLYTNLVYAGIEPSATIDATSMTHFHIDIWTPDALDGGNAVKVKLVDFGGNGTWDGGGDDVEHELTFNAETTPALETGTWVSLDIPLDDFENMTTRGAIAQLIISGVDGIDTLYVDNVYFHD